MQNHRSGWLYVIELLLAEFKNSNILLVDYMDTYFSYFYDLPKIINLKNESYYFLNKDAYYNIKDNDRSDVFIYRNKEGFDKFIKWYPKYNEFKLMRGELMINFMPKYNIQVLNDPWIGILHYPEFPDEMNYSSYEETRHIINSTHFKQSISCCKGIIVLSQHLKTYVEKIFKNIGLDIPIHVIFHPTDFDCIRFDYNKYKQNKSKTIIQLGFWLRNMKTIYEVDTNRYNKMWLPGGKYWNEMFQIIEPDYQKYLDNQTVQIPGFLSNSEYDELLSKNICLLNVYNSSANNSVLECIVRNTPLLVNPNPAIVEYLGKEYPLYYNNIKELNNLINSDDFDQKISDTVDYLINLDKTKLHIKYFISEVKKIINNIC
jgi:hypothetical protein